MKKIKEMRHHRCGSDLSAVEGLRDWYHSETGLRLLEQEKAGLEGILAKLFGYHLLQIGVITADDLLSSSLIPNCMVLQRDAGSVKLGDNLCRKIIGGLPDELPVASDSLDVILIPHVLEFSRNPHQVLREIDRVLIPEGHVVITGFNPWSNWLLWRLALGWRQQSPWCGRFLSLSKIKDWLSLLGFDIISTHHTFYRPPINHEGVMNRLEFLDTLGERFWPVFGASYTLVAKKRMFTFTPIKSRWRPRRMVTEGVAEPWNRGKINYIEDPDERS